MEWERATTDLLERQLVENQRLRSRLDAIDLGILEELDRRQAATADGCRSLSEWVASRIDVSKTTARSLVRTMRRTTDRPDLRDALSEGVSLDRVEALSKIPESIGLMEWSDVDGVHREAAKRARITAESESRSVEDMFFVMQPTLDESWWKVWGGLDGYSGEIVDKALSEAADQLPVVEGMPTDPAWKRATALVLSLVSDDAPPAQVTVIVDAKEAAPTNGEAGVTLESGTRVGQKTLEAILCDADTEIIAQTEAGRYMDYGRNQRTAPPSLRRALLHKYGHTCAGDSCDSKHRLQVHHIVPWAQGGETDQDNLILLCWFHHHVVIHQRGYTIYKTPTGRIRFKPPDQGRDPPI